MVSNSVTEPVEAKLESKVVPLGGGAGKSKPKSKMRPQRLRRLLLMGSFIIIVLLPCLLIGGYMAFVQSDRYVSSTGFAVRSMGSTGGFDLLGSFAGGFGGGGSTTSDSYIVLKYLESRDIVERLQAQVDLRQIFGKSDADKYSRLAPGSTIEELVEYWTSMISSSYNSTAGIISVDVEAFDPDDAKRIVDAVIFNVKALVNDLSEGARNDAVRFAEAEVKLGEGRLKSVQERIRQFREKQQSISPVEAAKMQGDIYAKLQAQLTETETRMSILGDSVGPDAPSMTALHRKADALRQQISEIRGAIVGDGDMVTDGEMGLSSQLQEYEALDLEKTFAEKAFASALASLEKARVEASRQQRYLALFSQPAVAEEAVYPRRFVSIFLLIFVTLSIWGSLTLIGYSLNDHLS